MSEITAVALTRYLRANATGTTGTTGATGATGAPGTTVSQVAMPVPGWETAIAVADLDRAPPGWPARIALRRYARSAADRARLEYQVLQALHAGGMPVPQPLHLEPDPTPFGGPFLLMEAIDGPTLQEASGSAAPDQQEALITRFAALFAAVHRFDWRPLVGPGAAWPDLQAAAWCYDEEWLRRELRPTPLYPAYEPVLDWLLARHRSVAGWRLALVHGDFHRGNILIRPPDSRWTVIDWGTPGIADPRVDLAITAMMITAYRGAGPARQLRDAYQQETGEPLSDMDYFEAFALTQRLWFTGVAFALGPEAAGLRPDLNLRTQTMLQHMRVLQQMLAERVGRAAAGFGALLDQWGKPV